MPRPLCVLVLAFGLCVLATPAKSVLPPRPSVVLITVDTLRPDRLGCYGHPTNHTPNIDRLAREGILFEDAYANMPWTTGSMASVMTGTYSSSHSLQLPTHRLRPDYTTLAEILHARGYQTGAIVGSFPLDSIFGLDRGFESYNDEFTLPFIAVSGESVKPVASRFEGDPAKMAELIASKLVNDAYRPDGDVTNAAVHWLDKIRDGRPFFLWVHYLGPHEKLNTRASILSQERGMIRRYDADVEATDRALGPLLERLRALGLLDSSVVVFHSDHGQSLGEHGYVGHALDLYNPSMQIPLVIRSGDAGRPAARIREQARNIDIAPTILDILGIESPPQFIGRSLTRSDGDPAVQPGVTGRVAYFETYIPTLRPVLTSVFGRGMVLAPVVKTGLRTEQWTLLTTRVTGSCSQSARATRGDFGNPRLFDPIAMDDAQCRNIETTELYRNSGAQASEENLAGQQPEVVATLKDLLAVLSAGTERPDHQMSLSVEQQQKLKSLGYVH